MNEETAKWFHCGRCGHLFQSTLHAESRRCSACGRDPSTFHDSPPRSGPAGLTPLPARPISDSEESSLPQKRTVRKRRGNSKVFKIVLAWLVLVILFAVMGKKYAQQDDQLGNQVRTSLIENVVANNADSEILTASMPECANCLSGFLSSGTPEERNQYVSNPINLAGKMARFDSMNPLMLVNPADVKINSQRLIILETGPAIATTWDVADGRKLDAVFYKEDGEWRLDWEQFVHFSEVPWPLFLAGSGRESEEFRLMARLKSVDEKSADSQLSLVLYNPRFGYPNDPTSTTPGFSIRRNSDDGRLLIAAFHARRTGKSPFDGALATADPEGMIRLRVRVKRSEEQKGRSFVIEKVIACHWLSTNQPGLNPLSPQQIEEEHIESQLQPSKPKD